MAPVEVKQEGKVENLGSQTQIIVFKIGNEEYGLTIDVIKEVVVTPQITPVPLSPDYVLGVANIRGNILSIVALDKCLKIKTEIFDSNQSYTLVLASQEFKVGLIVRDLPNTLSVFDNEIDTQLINDSSFQQSHLKGLVKKGNRIIILIDVFKILDNSIEMLPEIKN
ncbi:MAG: chemotaxis protein CheW [Cytophagales bacterium]